jgi:ElaB/YqjD/DUF883 family membrane-anchored ribosome-binding protein
MEAFMSNQDLQRGSPTSSGGATSSQSGGMRDRIGDVASQAFSQASDVARDAGAKARQAAADTASDVGAQVKDAIDRQIGTGAHMAGQFASSVRLAADDLASQSPLLSGAVRSFADKVEEYADDVKDRTVEELVRTASDFTRRQPALVFGLAALAGFVIFRTVKSAPAAVAAPPIQPGNHDHGFNYRGAGEHGL